MKQRSRFRPKVKVLLDAYVAIPLKILEIHKPGQFVAVLTRLGSWNSNSSHGIANEPWLLNSYSSSAWTKSFLKMGWFRCVTRTTNLLQLLPTQTTTCPANTSNVCDWLTAVPYCTIVRFNVNERGLFSFSFRNSEIQIFFFIHLKFS